MPSPLPGYAVERCFEENNVAKSRVIVESPYKPKCKGKIAYQKELKLNLLYARACMRDSALRGEAPYASHLLLTQDGILDDRDPVERQMGIDIGLTWGETAALSAVYIDRGISGGMKYGIRHARMFGRLVEYRSLYGAPLPTEDPV